MTARRGSRGMGETYPPGSETYPPCVPGDRNHDHSYPPGRSTSETPVQGHKSIDVTGDPGDRTRISTTRDVREEKTHGLSAQCGPMCPHLDQEKFSAHPVKGRNLPPDHPDPPAHRCICASDQRTCTRTGENLPPGEPGPTPREPERIGPLAAKYLDRLATRRRTTDLIEASSLGTPDAVALRQQGARQLTPELTGMPEEQADWDSTAEADPDLAARQAAALNRLARQKPALRRSKP